MTEHGRRIDRSGANELQQETSQLLVGVRLQDQPFRASLVELEMESVEKAQTEQASYHNRDSIR